MAQRKKQDKSTYKQKANKKTEANRRNNTSKAIQQQQEGISAERRAELQQAVNRAEHEKIQELVAQFPKDMQQLSFNELLAMRIVAGKPVISLCMPKLLGDLDWESDPREAQGKLSWIFDEFRDLKWHIAEQRVIKEQFMKLDLLFDPDDEENEISGISSVAHLWIKCKQFMSSVNSYRRDRSDECEQHFGPKFYVRFWRRNPNMGWKTYFMYNAFVARECKELRLEPYDITRIEVKGLLKEYFPSVNVRVHRAGGYNGDRISTNLIVEANTELDLDRLRRVIRRASGQRVRWEKQQYLPKKQRRQKKQEKENGRNDGSILVEQRKAIQSLTLRGGIMPTTIDEVKKAATKKIRTSRRSLIATQRESTETVSRQVLQQHYADRKREWDVERTGDDIRVHIGHTGFIFNISNDQDAIYLSNFDESLRYLTRFESFCIHWLFNDGEFFAVDCKLCCQQESVTKQHRVLHEQKTRCAWSICDND